VVAVIAVLMIVVIGGKGFVEGSRVAAVSQNIDTMRKAVREWSKRYKNGVTFDTLKLSLLQSSGAKILPDNFKTPWGGKVCVLQDGTDPTYMVIYFCTPNPAVCSDVIEMIKTSAAETPTCTPTGAAPGGCNTTDIDDIGTCATGESLFKIKTR
jgi:hypothetical protein